MKHLLFCFLLLLGSLLFGDNTALLNGRLGLPLFGRDSLWEEDIHSLAKRLRLPPPDNSPQGRISTYTRGRKCLGTTLNQLIIEYQDGTPVKVTLVLGNKGDSAANVRERKLNTFLSKSKSEIKKHLTTCCGPSKMERESLNGQEREYLCWTCDNAKFRLEAVTGEFIMLHIVPADQKTQGRAASIKEAQLTTRNSSPEKNVRKNQKGDVWIENIPMIDQGNKGYCAPATLERILLYYGLKDVDMHHIASDANTKYGGGTTLGGLLQSSSKLFHHAGLELHFESLNLRKIQKIIDRGYPIIWGMFVSDQYLSRVRDNTNKRKRQNAARWAKNLKNQKKLKRDTSGAHLCLIVGYNAQTQEIAISNSWASQREPWWLSIRDANCITQPSRLCYLAPK